MEIETEEQLESAVQEYQSLREAPNDSPEAERRTELDAQIKAFYHRHGDEVRRAKPPR